MRALAVIGILGLLATVSSAASSADFLTRSLNDCIGADSWGSCLKHEVLGYLDDKLGTSTEARSLESVDEALVARTFKYLKSFEYGVDLPFVDASLKYRPARSLADLDIEFKDNEVATSQARGILKKKLLLPFLLLFKLKLKLLMPIFVAIIGLKAIKALVLSKLAIILVVGFIAVQFLKKGGMTPPMGEYTNLIFSNFFRSAIFKILIISKRLLCRPVNGARKPTGRSLRCSSSTDHDFRLRAGQHVGRQRPILASLDAQQRR